MLNFDTGWSLSCSGIHYHALTFVKDSFPITSPQPFNVHHNFSSEKDPKRMGSGWLEEDIFLNKNLALYDSVEACQSAVLLYTELLSVKGFFGFFGGIFRKASVILFIARAGGEWPISSCFQVTGQTFKTLPLFEKTVQQLGPLFLPDRCFRHP